MGSQQTKEPLCIELPRNGEAGKQESSGDFSKGNRGRICVTGASSDVPEKREKNFAGDVYIKMKSKAQAN